MNTSDATANDITGNDLTAGDMTSDDMTSKAAAAKKVATLSASLIALKREASADGFVHPFRHPEPPPTAIKSLLNWAGGMLPLAIVLLVLNLLVMLTWLVWETSVNSAGEPVVADTGSTDTGLSNTGNPASPVIEDSAPPSPPPEASSAEIKSQPEIKAQSEIAAPSPPEIEVPPEIKFNAKPLSKPPVPAKYLTTPAKPAKPGYRVQIYALASDAAVRKAWPRLQKAHPDLLGGLKLNVVRSSRGPLKGMVYRMQVGTLTSAATARKLCDRLRKRKLDCIVVRS